ncbi:Uncharacterised protein [Vibrio cholerae]|nr:Uncharacterised protein [Vibrio cholerae]
MLWVGCPIECGKGGIGLLSEQVAALGLFSLIESAAETAFEPDRYRKAQNLG